MAELTGATEVELESIISSFQKEGSLDKRENEVVLVDTKHRDEKWQVSHKIRQSVVMFNNILEFSLNLEQFIRDLESNQ